MSVDPGLLPQPSPGVKGPRPPAPPPWRGSAPLRWRGACVAVSGLDLKDRSQKVAPLCPAQFCDQEISPRGAVSGSRLASALILKTAAALDLFRQSIYFALGEREHEVTQLKRPMTLKRTDECADDTSSSYNLAILRILGGLIDLLKLSSQPFGFRGGLGWPTSVVDGEQDGCRYCEVTVYHGNFHTRSWGKPGQLLLEMGHLLAYDAPRWNRFHSKKCKTRP